MSLLFRPDGVPSAMVPVTALDDAGNSVTALAIATSVVSSTGVQAPAGTVVDPTFNRPVGSGSIAAGQASVTTSATQVVPARAGRAAVTLSSATAVAYWVGPSGVTSANGYSVPATAGAGITIPTAAAVFAVGASAVTVTYIETF